MPSPRHLRPLAPVLLSALALAGCGSDSPAPAAAGTPTAARVQPALGQVYNAGIEARCMPTGAVLGSGDTGASGEVTLSLAGSCSGPVIVELVANGGSTYYDEALATTVGLPVGTQLRAIVPSYVAGSPLAIAITPLTEIATRQALAAAGGSESAVTGVQATTANAAVTAQVLGAGISFDILTPPTPWSAATAAGSLGTSVADRYAFYLAALAAMGSGSTPAIAVTDALAADLADGALDGATSSGFTYTSGGYAGLRDTGLADVATYASTELKDALGLTPPAPVDVTGLSPGSGAVDDQVTLTGTGFGNDPFHLEVKFSSNVAAEIVSASDTELVVKVPAGAVTGSISVRNIISDTTDTTASFTVTGGGTPASWTLRSSPTAWLLFSVAYGNGNFVAVGYNRTILTSTDGVSWTSQTASDSNYYQANSVTWDGSQFVLVGDSSNLASYAPVIATSPDGVTWTRRNWTRGSETQLVDVWGNGSTLTAAGANGAVIASSDSGATWSGETLPAASYITQLFGVAGNGSTRILVGKNDTGAGIILANTGSGWTQVGSAWANFAPRDVIWTGSQFVAVGGDSYNYGANAVVLTSSDGSSWTRVALPVAGAPAGYTLRDVTWTGSVLVAVGDNGGTGRVVTTSSDGSSWTQAHQSTTSGNSALDGVASGGGKVVAVGGTRTVTAP